MVYACKVVTFRTLPHLTSSKVAKVLAPFEARNIHQHTPTIGRDYRRLRTEEVKRQVGMLLTDACQRNESPLFYPEMSRCVSGT